MRNVLITGSNEGIGLCMVKLCLERGHRVFLTARSRAKCDAARVAIGETLATADRLHCLGMDAHVYCVCGGVFFIELITHVYRCQKVVDITNDASVAQAVQELSQVIGWLLCCVADEDCSLSRLLYLY